MSYLLKEVLKTLCGVNQWSYAVFWKMNCQNPKLLIWGGCYCDGFSSSSSSSSSSSFALEKVNLLVNKMRADGNVKVVGEGFVGSVALTGKYEWISPEICCGEPQCVEVLKEALQQFSAGMQTVAVVPVLPHGVIQFGSRVAIQENIGFVKDVASLILELGHIPGALESENHEIAQWLLPLGSNTINASYSGCSFNSPECSTRASISGHCQTFSQASNLVSSAHHEPYENLESSSMHTPVLDDKCSGQSGHHQDPIFLKGLAFINTSDRTESDLCDVVGGGFKKTMFHNSLNGDIRNEPQKISEILSFTGDSDHLLEAVVSKGGPNRSSCESVHCVSTLTNVSGSSSVSKSLLLHGVLGNFNHMPSELFGVSMGKEVSSAYSRGSCVYDPWAEKGFVASKPGRKRRKAGENPRPRPRDRQLIQDLVKELREIVPNGAKCSIDCLLERTIKHMVFLQGVTKHAEKLKQTAESEIIREDGDTTNTSESGVTWGYEVGLQPRLCPIVVEDINQQPHQMLVQILCEEHGSFLEVAGIIREMGLTVLNGVMENRDDKMWARFTVEANFKMTRMDIFLLLARRLNQKGKLGFSTSNIETENAMVQECHQAASVLC